MKKSGSLLLFDEDRFERDVGSTLKQPENGTSAIERFALDRRGKDNPPCRKQSEKLPDPGGPN